MGQAVSSAAHTAQAEVRDEAARIGGSLREGAQSLGFKNPGEAVSTAVHEAQQSFRDAEAEAEDRDVESSGGAAGTGSPTPSMSPRRP
jgi:hypothetical protein